MLVLPVCFLLSGFAGIVYQIAWARQFALVFGTTEIAVTGVLAAFMAGLGLGAWLIQRYLPYINRPALAYAVLELIVGASAVVLVPLLIAGNDWLLWTLAGHHPEPPAAAQLNWISVLYAGGAFAAVIVPTVCMGATLPLLTRHIIESDRQTGPRVGLLFTFNTAGAVAGSLAAVYWLLPSLGLTRTVWSAAILNIVAALLALTVAQRPIRRRSGFSAAWSAAGRASFSRPPSPVWILPLMLISGAVGLFHEVLWTRMLSHVLGSSLHAFGLMLASFLGGLALGGAVGSPLARNRRVAVSAFASSQIGGALAAVGAYIALDRVLADSLLTENSVHASLLAVAILVPVAFFSGITFPLAVRILARRTEDAAPAAARVYAWNTLGAVLGALASGFVLIPALRFEGSIQLAVAVSAALAVAASLMLERPSRGLTITMAALTLAVVALFWPTPPMALLRSSPLRLDSAGRMLYYGVGRSAAVVVLEQDGTLAFRTNGLPEALVEMRDSAPHISGEKWLVPLAMLARPDATDLLMVGYGGGVVLDGVPDHVKHIDVLEIEPRVIDANFTTRSLREQDPLADPRVHVIVNDARAALNLTDRRYEAIVSQPSHPWTAAASHLYTREFLRQARAHLVDQGVFVQWMNLSFIDEALLRSFAATVLDVFGDARVYRPDPFTLVFVAGGQPGDGFEAFPQFGINTPEDVFVVLAADGQALRQISRGVSIITDDRNRMATASAYRTDLSMRPATADRLFAAFDPLRAAGGSGFGFRPGVLARRLAVRAATDPGARVRLDSLASGMDPASVRGYEVSVVRLGVANDRDAAQDLIRQGLARYPDNETLRFEYIKPWLTRLARGTATKDVTAQAAKLTRSADAVVRGTVLASQQRWAELHAMDTELAEASWNDPWKLEAVLLQVQWRCQEEGTPEIRRQQGKEALHLIDDAIAAQPALVLYAMRVQSALAARRPEAVVESVWEYGHGLYADSLAQVDGEGPRDAEAAVDAVDSPDAAGASGSAGAADPPDRTQARDAINSLLALLDQQAGADPARVAEVRTRLMRDVRELSQ